MSDAFLTATEAAQRAGVTESAVRAWLKSGKLKGTKNTDGQWQISTHELMGMLATTPPTKQSAPHQRVADDAHSADAVALVSETLRLANAALDRERMLCDELRRQVEDLNRNNNALHAEIRALHAEIQALLSGEHDSTIMRWVRSQMSATSPKTVTHATTTTPQEAEIIAPEGQIPIEVATPQPRSNSAPSDEQIVPAPQSLPHTASTTSLPKPQPKISEFASKCVKLAQSGLTPEQIAENLTGSDKKYTASQVRMALRNR